ncbi:tetratricopeptide repeat protein [Algoriphagus aestuarii]|nr:tetratricopeptide repeat protein [Algoriphagus aestuarii]
MKRVLFMLLLVICASPIIAQTNDSIPRLDPKTRKVLNTQDQAAYQLGLRYADPIVAKTKLFELMVRNPEDLRYPELLAGLYFENNQFTSAALVAMDILSVNDKSVGALEIAAYSLEQVGALDRALPHFESLYLLTGDNFSLYKSGFIQYSLKRYDEALNSANMLIKNAKAEEKIGFNTTEGATQEISMKAAALNLKGMIYLDQGSKPEAKTAFEEAIQLDSNYELAKENLKKAQ